MVSTVKLTVILNMQFLWLLFKSVFVAAVIVWRTLSGISEQSVYCILSPFWCVVLIYLSSFGSVRSFEFEPCACWRALHLKRQQRFQREWIRDKASYCKVNLRYDMLNGSFRVYMHILTITTTTRIRHR